MADANDLNLAAYERALRARNRSERTIQNYIEAIGQLADHHGGADVTELGRPEVEAYISAVLAAHKATTAAVRFRALRAFYNWAVAEEIIERSPMAKMVEPAVTDEPVPIVPDDHLRALLKACAGKEFEDRRDTAIIRLFCEPGSPRVSEMAGLRQDDFELRRSLVRILGKGDKVRVIPFGAKTGQAIDRYLRLRAKHKDSSMARMWLGAKARGPLTASGMYQMLGRRCEQAGIPQIHPHQLRHTSAHIWKAEGGNVEDMMELFGWTSDEMPRRYGRSAGVERAQKAARRMSPADRL